MVDLSTLTNQDLIKQIYDMGRIIRQLDNDNIHYEYWTNDDDEESLEADRHLEIQMALHTDRFNRDGNH